jgi:POT family proton-dependent oligopeptide transporter
MRNNYGWGYAFAAAGVGMIIGLIVFASGTKHVKEADILKPAKAGDLPTWVILASTILPMLIFGVIGYFLKGVTGADNPGGNFFGTDSNDAFIFGCIPVILFFVYMMLKADTEDRRPIAALLSVFACIVIFWAIFHQNGDALTVWAEEYTHREMPQAIGPAADNIGMAQRVTYGEWIDMDEAQYQAHLDSLVNLKKTFGDKTPEYKALTDEISLIESSKKYFHNLPVNERPEIDKWILSRLNTVIGNFSDFMEEYELTKAHREIQSFVVDELSNWYIRRNRRRFWKGENDKDKIAAYQTLKEVLLNVT